MSLEAVAGAAAEASKSVSPGAAAVVVAALRRPLVHARLLGGGCKAASCLLVRLGSRTVAIGSLDELEVDY